MQIFVDERNASVSTESVTLGT